MLICQVSFAQPDEKYINDYNINVALDLIARQFDMNTQVDIQKKDSSSILEFLLSNYASINSVCLDNSEIIPFRYSGKDTVVLTLQKKTRKNVKLHLIFKYTLPADSFKVDKGMFVMKRSDRWYPFQVGHLFNSRLIVAVPENQITISNGKCMKKLLVDHLEKYAWRTKYEHDLSLFIFDPDSMEYKSENIERTRLNFYFVPGLKDEQKIISLVRSSFIFYSKLIGKYQDRNFTVIEIPAEWFLGQGLHSFLLFTPVLLKNIPDPRAWVPHEVGHQWIGNIIPIYEQAKGFWFVEESLDEYLKAMFVEHEYGSDSLQHYMSNFYLANYKANVKNGKDVSIMDVTSVNNSIEEAQAIYAKGPIILHKLSKCMSDESWTSMIKEIYKNFQHQLFTLDDFKKCIRRYDHDGHCLKLFNDLLHVKAIPESIRFE
jgi:hypothetical protein